MSSIKIAKSITVPGSPELVWRHLTQPELIVDCLPGASLTSSSEDGRTHEGKMKVKLGALTVAYAGSAEFVELDPESQTLELRARGREKVGSGTASMTMRSALRSVDGGTEIDIDSDVQLTGKLVSMGRGMIGAVADELLDEFSTRLADTLQEARADEDGEDRAEGDGEAGATGPRAEGAEGGSDSASGSETPEALSGFGILFRAFRRWVRGLFGG